MLIAHRGNLEGPIPEKENEPSYIMTALTYGYDVEVDVRYIKGELKLGHDEPKYIVDKYFLKNPQIWVHAKDLQTFNYLISCHRDIHCFFHDTDDATLTSKGYIWTYPGKPLFKRSICVLPEKANYTPDELKECNGICSDNIIYYSNLLKNWSNNIQDFIKNL